MKVALVILDGWGFRNEKEGNAILLANTPNFNYLLSHYPHTLINAAGEAVGLPKSQMGNSEVGHLNIGAGRIVYQDFMRINKAIECGEFYNNKVLISSIMNSSTIHFIGLLSDGGVHSHIEHLYALLELAKKFNKNKIFIHAFLDGRDTPPTSGINYVKALEEKCKEIGIGKIVTIMGRYYGMDRDKRWDRTQKAYNAIVLGEGEKADSAYQVVEESYKKGITDEFIVPTVIGEYKGVEDGDTIICYNFRADRVRQITESLTKEEFSFFERKKFPKVKFVCMVLYRDDFDLPIIFPQEKLEDVLGKVFEDYKIRNLRIAETEKYAHVTYFFNGGEEKMFQYEDRVLIPSPKVATYDLKPQMSAYEITEKIIEKINEYQVMIINYANPDMVGHTGNLSATISAIEHVDICLGKILKVFKENDWRVIVTGDHGNAETMMYPDGSPHTTHTSNPVPFILIGEENVKLKENGKLGDIAPTILKLLNIPQPKSMTGIPLY
jgi:2,3-bisphosphoglycerate-independent phosphoglycerate mutase